MKLKTQKFYVAITDRIIHILLFWIKKMSMNFLFKTFINHYGFCNTKTSHDLDSLLSNRCQSEHLTEVCVSVGQARDLVCDQPGVLHTLRHPAQGGDALVVHQGHLHIDDLPQTSRTPP